jgi:hypothetical protein
MFSDFFAMRDIAYIPFSSMSECLIERPPAPKVRVYRRSRLSALLELSEVQFVEWCILSGNDFTNSFPISDFTLGTVVNVGKNMLKETMRIIKASGEELISSHNPRLQEAIEFSRKFYQLEDVSSYPPDARSEVRTLRLSDQDKDLVDKWVCKQGSDFSQGSLGYMAIECLTSLSGVQCNLMEHVTPLYLEAVEGMLRVMAEPATVKIDKSAVFAHVPYWNDLLFVHHYQLLCRYLGERTPLSMEADEVYLSFLGFYLILYRILYYTTHICTEPTMETLQCCGVLQRCAGNERHSQHDST